MAHPLDGVQAKLDRAAEHAHALRDQLAPLDPSQFYDTEQKRRPKRDKQGGIWVDGYLKVVKEPPLKLGILAGDWAHNLRGSLDHLVYQLAILDHPRGKAPEGTFFPVAKSEAEYLDPGPCGSASLRERALAGIKETHRTMIDKVQPYVGHTRLEADSQALSVLNAFANVDKHWIIQPAAIQPIRLDAVPEEGQFTIKIVLPKRPGAIADGTNVYSLRLDGVALDSQVRVKTLFVFRIGFGNRGLDVADLLNMCVAVGEYVAQFRPLWP